MVFFDHAMSLTLLEVLEINIAKLANNQQSNPALELSTPMCS